MEDVMMDMMYQIPSDESISKCQITREMVEENLRIEDEEPLKIEEK